MVIYIRLVREEILRERLQIYLDIIIVIINVLNVRCDIKNGVRFDFNFLP